MNIRARLISTMLFISSTAWAGTGDAVHKPMHVCVLVTVKDIDYELLADAKAVQIYVRDHGKVDDLSKATGAYKLSPGTKVVVIASSVHELQTNYTRHSTVFNS